MSLQLRVTSPAARTDELVRVLTSMAGVFHLVVLPGARQPAGDAVQFDVHRAAANAVLVRLSELGFDQHGPIMVQEVDADVGAPPSPGRIRIVQGDVPPVWAMVDARIRTDAVYPPSFYGLLIIAGLIAAVGILTNSTILIVGAMVVGPEYGAIMGVALGIDRRERRPVTTGLLALLAGFTAAIAASLVFGVCIRALGHTPHLYHQGVRPVSDLISAPDLFSVVVALLAGAVGVISLTEARTGALIGVFISVTTIPAAANTGLSLAYTSWDQSGGSVVQLVLNVVILVGVGAAGLRLQRKLWRRHTATG